MNNLVKTAVISLFSIGLVSAIGYSVWDKNFKTNSQTTSISSSSNLIEVNGIITSEKDALLNDSEFIKIIEKNGFHLNSQKWTSDQIIAAKNKSDLGKYNDFIFPSTNQVSDRVKQTFKGSQSSTILYSPMVIATRTPITNIMQSNNLLINKGQYNALDMGQFLDLMSKKVKWSSLKQNTEYSVNKNILISTSDAKRSGSSKMFISLSSYILNDKEIVQEENTVDKVVPKIKELMNAQGYRESSSTDLFNDYVSIGLGKAPMIFVYESQMIELAVKNQGLKDKMQILYPSPTIFSKHIIVALSSNGEKFMNLLNTNEDIKKVAARYGFRITGGNHLVEVAKSVNITIPDTIVDVIDQPSLEIQDELINKIESK